MDQFEKLDVVLQYLNIQTTPPIKTISEITKDIKDKIHSDESEILLILDLLEQDGYISFDDRDVQRTSNISFHTITIRVRYYIISYRGRLFLYKPTGYVREEADRVAKETRLKKIESTAKANQTWMTILTILIAVGTLVAGVYYWYATRQICNCVFWFEK